MYICTVVDLFLFNQTTLRIYCHFMKVLYTISPFSILDSKLLLAQDIGDHIGVLSITAARRTISTYHLAGTLND